MNPKIIICLAILLSLLLAGCTTQSQPGILGRWTVAGTDNVVVIAEGHRALLIDAGKRFRGSWRMVAPDLLVLTLASGSSQLETSYHITPDAWLFRILHRMGNANLESSPVSK